MATNPSFGINTHHPFLKPGNSSPSRRPRAAPFVGRTNVIGNDPNSCQFCQDREHNIANCSRFAGLPYQERFEIIRNSALCFACLKRGHRSAECQRRERCAICNFKHPTVLHRTDTTQPVDVSGVTSCRIRGEASQAQTTLPVVPIDLHHGCKAEVTWAFLDSGSTHSFISQPLVTVLKIQESREVSLSLTTVDRETEITSMAVNNAWLSDTDGINILKLPQLFSVENIPVDKSDFPTQAERDKWDHLRNVRLNSCEDEVGLLLGADAFLAMEPLEVIPSKGPGSPFAVRARFGWIVSGLRGVPPYIHATNYKTTVRANSQAIEELDTNQASLNFQPPTSFVFQPLNQMSAAEEFDIAEETDSVHYDTETKETASEVTEIARRSDVSPSRGGSEVVRLLASLHDLSRQVEVTTADLRAQIGNRLGNQSWPAEDYDLADQTRPRQSTSTQRIKQITTVSCARRRRRTCPRVAPSRLCSPLSAVCETSDWYGDRSEVTEV